ncbi:MAG: potassium-transporting ATPase subunit KdpC [Rickettsiales bacterium]
MSLLTYIRSSVLLLVWFSLLLGGGYTVFVTLIAQGVFPHQANGSLIEKGGVIVGSELIGQQFSDPKYFWGRLSATTPPYNAAHSQGSNMSPANPVLVERVKERAKMLQEKDPNNIARIPVDLVTASASGLDPHISFAAAMYQVPRVAKLRKMEQAQLMALVEKHSDEPLLGFMGQTKVNVLALNIALDEAVIMANPSEKR